MTPEIADILDHRADFDPAADLDALAKTVPAAWVVYLFQDADDQPVQLLYVKNLRQSLRRRLGGDESLGLSKRVNYRDLVRRIRWRRVDSAFEADWIYHEAARRAFPESYRGMVGFRPAWFIHVDPEAQFPRYVKTNEATNSRGLLLGPIEDKHAAARLIELLEDCFDLCRYYNILIQAPRGKACAYKEMGKCPAPCDGSIGMEQYRRMIEISAAAAIDPRPLLRQHALRMGHAAAELRFETAGRIKAHIDQLSQLGQGPFRHVRKLSDFRYLSLQRGPRPRTAKAFLVLPGHIEETIDLIDDRHPAEALRAILAAAESRRGAVLDQVGAERVGIVAHHLFSPKQGRGIFLLLDEITEQSLGRGFADVQKQKPADEGDGEGVMKELQAM